MKLLSVVDGSLDAETIHRELTRQMPHIILERASTLTEGRACLSHPSDYDVVMIDMRLPDGSGLDLLNDIRSQALPLAVVMRLRPDNEAAILSMLNAGADDYVVTRDGYLGSLSVVLERALARFRVESAHKLCLLRVLYADNASEAELARQHVSQYAAHIQLDSIHIIAEALQRLPLTRDDPCDYDVVLLNTQLEGLSPLDMLKTLRQDRGQVLPIVLIIQPEQEDLAAQALRLGASDYLVAHPRYLFKLPMVLDKAHHYAQLERERIALHLSEVAEREQRQIVEALRDSVAALTGSLDVDTVMRRFLEYAGRVVSYDTASIILFEGDTARVAYWRNFSPEAEGFFRHHRFSMASSKFQSIRENGKSYLISDTTTSTQWISSTFDNWVRSSIGVPIRVLGEIIGLLAVDSATPNQFRSVDVERLQTFAHYAAATLENAHLHADLKRYARDLEQRDAVRSVELDREQAQLRTVMDAMGEGVVYITLPETRIEYYNPSFSELTGYPFGPQSSKMTFVLEEVMKGVSPEVLKDLMTTLQKNGMWRGELQIHHHQTQDLITVALTGAPVRSAKRDPVGAVLLVRDISEQKVLQGQKDRFIANAAHELRTPMTLIMTRLYLIKKQPEHLPMHLKQLEDAIQHMKNLIESLLDLARFEWGMMTLTPIRTHLQPLISTIFAHQQSLADQNQVHLTTDFSAEPLYADVDSTRIRQLLDNLIVNAMNHTPQGNQITLRLYQKFDEIVMEVEDTGVGIPEDAIPHLFEPFYRVGGIRAPGTGLGLPLSKEIVDLHHGKISVVSQADKGTTITIKIPIHPNERDQAT